MGDYIPDTIPFASVNYAQTIEVYFCDWEFAINANRTSLAGEFAQKLLLGHPVFEGFTAVNEDHGDFVGELAAELIVGVDIHFAPGKAAAAMNFADGLFHDLA